MCREWKAGQSSSMRLTLRPEAMPMDFLVRPQSKIDPDEVWACAKQSQPIFNKSTRFEDMRNFNDEKLPFQRLSAKKPMNKASRMESRDDDLDLPEFSLESKFGQSSSMRLTSRHEAMPMDFLVRPQFKIDPDEVRARAK
ncbi:hypothetical protein LOK49_LG11G02043 [Camellia lanceoleosa]|uniref:Uncharacterized protein n=1 Tax=Camellia lanceoleosa TaxID=1840588 RepID=A0ACC0G3E6_9ERIC|nr:hypothetical protein LOK49_LG11G02043 [Camellia lanceoleosa]